MWCVFLCLLSVFVSVVCVLFLNMCCLGGLLCLSLVSWWSVLSASDVVSFICVSHMSTVCMFAVVVVFSWVCFGLIDVASRHVVDICATYAGHSVMHSHLCNLGLGFFLSMVSCSVSAVVDDMFIASMNLFKVLLLYVILWCWLGAFLTVMYGVMRKHTNMWGACICSRCLYIRLMSIISCSVCAVIGDMCAVSVDVFKVFLLYVVVGLVHWVMYGCMRKSIYARHAPHMRTHLRDLCAIDRRWIVSHVLFVCMCLELLMVSSCCALNGELFGLKWKRTRHSWSWLRWSWRRMEVCEDAKHIGWKWIECVSMSLLSIQNGYQPDCD